MTRYFRNSLFRAIALLLGVLLGWDLLSHLIAEVLWFNELGYLFAFLVRLRTQFGLWAVASIISAGFLLGNLFLANRLKYSDTSLLSRAFPEAQPVHRQHLDRTNSGLRAEPQTIPRPIRVGTRKSLQEDHVEASGPLRLRSLLPVVFLLSLLVGFMVLHYSQIAISLWHRDMSLVNVTPPLPTPFGWTSLQTLILSSWINQIWPLGVLVVITIALIVNPQFWLTAIAAVFSLFFALVLSVQWGRILQYFYPTPFNASEPLFGHDISFYVFSIPVWQLLDFWLGGLFLFSLVAVLLIYLLAGDSFSQGKFPGFSQGQMRHLYGLGAGMAAMVAVRYWLSRYELLYSTRGVTYGASYTDVRAQLPINTALSILAAAIALFLLFQTVFWFHRLRLSGRAKLMALGLYLIVSVVATNIAPAVVQRFGVQPNELARERLYIERSISLTRAAFDLDDIEVETFNPQGALTTSVLEDNELTIRNIRLWDTRPILQTNRQLQQIRPYYRFPDADIDRYLLRADATGVSPITGGQEARQAEPEADQITVTPDESFTVPSEPLAIEKQQVHIAARELDYQSVPEQAQTWVNKHLIYTHGYGFTVSPVNIVANAGLPAYFVKDIGTALDAAEGNLFTSSEFIREAIPIYNPRIYYGELTNTYVMTSTRVGELDFPSGDENAYTVYYGAGGIGIGSPWRRLLFAEYLKDWQMLFTRDFTPQTKVLFRRNINQRIRTIAPFLHYDQDPYIVSVDPDETEPGAMESHLYWIVDAYTTSDRYPYSDPGQHEFNYIRNSVKAVIDAYHGDVTFYVADLTDPIIQTWSKIFPGLFQPLDAMPDPLLRHIRYPRDFYSVQSERLLAYHMTDPQVFYNQEDLWRIPQELYGVESQAVEPYYLIMRLPTEASEEFILLQPYTPVARNNLIGWLAARSDGAQYGNLLLYQFPKQELIYGPEQIEALINQDPVISQQISLWNRQGSRAVQGNLLVIPIEQSLLYVEPVYLEAEQNSLPTLIRVIVIYENRIIMAETLEAALNGIFQPEDATPPAIIRPLEAIPAGPVEGDLTPP
ncbi:MAG: UPF0182 family protein [Kastovskya adunca ATA6-11-RM4]|jgi:hypothetical protein|nr:UPF0182 family protein [Kastovskya adunca ATA6-11-RM4]